MGFNNMNVSLNITEIQATLKEFATQRDWNKFHDPKNLSMSLAAEAGELLEIFQWLTSEEASQAKNNSELRQKTAHELADILLNAIRLADLMDINLDTAIKEKIVLNGKKYPVELVKGKAKKYSEY